MYGVILVSYRGRKMEMWVQGINGRFETSSLQEATDMLNEYSSRHPDGIYTIISIDNENGNSAN